MNKFQGILSGGSELKDNYPSAAYDALQKRKYKLRDSLEKRASQIKNIDEEKNMSPPRKSIRPMKEF